MGNLVRVAEGEAAPSGMDAVHGVVHRLKPADMAKLAHLEHEYRYSTVQYREREREMAQAIDASLAPTPVGAKHPTQPSSRVLGKH